MPRSPEHPITPDGRYFVVRGRLWRRSDPLLSADARQALVNALMDARRGVRDALRCGDDAALRAARSAVDAAKHGLGERGAVWWDDGAPDYNRRMAAGTPYAGWFCDAHAQEKTMTFPYRAERLGWDDEVLKEVELPGGTLRMTRGLGSGLARRETDAPGLVWAVGDRGPNFKVKVAVKTYGVDGLEHLLDTEGAKIMPALEHGPALSSLRIEDDRVVHLETLMLRGGDGRPLSGLPAPATAGAECEPIFSLEGKELGTDPSGVDGEGIVALSDGGYWIGDEYGPSLLRLDATGAVQVRWVPAGTGDAFGGATYPIADVLPPLAAARRLNRGFEALALSPDERWLYLAFQSPLAHPDRDAHDTSRNVRLWQLDSATGALHAEYVYRLETPEAFARDQTKGEFAQNDVKVSEIVMLGPDRLLVLERGSASTKFFRVNLDPSHATPAPLHDPATRPTLEQLDEAGLVSAGVVPLVKTLVLDTDVDDRFPADLEGAVLLTPATLLLVNDNDFGVEGAQTEFWRVTFDAPLG
ncbi:MAG TPA: esterase-like activity of phytase family protein [Sphingomonadaceae bacterium]|nr:esterase-like activity of phytase family protein [Sphingomonadaceae bacterium]